MLNETRVSTSYTTGTTINLGAIATKMFLLNTAATVIVQSKAMNCHRGEFNMVEITMDLPEYDLLVDDYCRGIHAAFTSGMVEQSVQILYKFVQDCVLNGTVNGLYLLNDKTTHGFYFYQLITKALDVYMEEITEQYTQLNELDKLERLPKYNEYNKEFLELFKRS